VVFFEITGIHSCYKQFGKLNLFSNVQMSSVEKVSSSPTSKQEFGEDMKSSRLTSKEIVDGLIPQEGPLPPTMIMDLELTLWELTLWELFKNGRKGRKGVL
jgi:hypothetical protein